MAKKNIDYSYQPLPYGRVEETVPMNNCGECPLVVGKIYSFNGNEKLHGLNCSWGSFDPEGPIEYVFVIDKGNRFGDALTHEPKAERFFDALRRVKIDSFYILPLSFCRLDKAGETPRMITTAQDHCHDNVETIFNNILEFNEKAGKKPPKVILVGKNSVHRFIETSTLNKKFSIKSQLLKEFKSSKYPGIDFYITYAPAFYSRPERYQDFEAIVRQLKLIKEDRFKMDDQVPNDYILIEDLAMLESGISVLKQSEKVAYDIESSGFNYVPMIEVTEKKVDKMTVKTEDWRVDYTIGISFTNARHMGIYIPLWVKGKHISEANPEMDVEEFLIKFGSNYEDERFYFWFGQDQVDHVRNLLKTILQNPKIKTIAHNGKFDNKFLKMNFDLEVTNFWYDTMLACHIVNEEDRKGLQDQVDSRYIDLVGYKDTVYSRLKKDQQEDETDYSDIPLEILAAYGCGDVDATFRLQEDTLEQMRLEKKNRRKGDRVDGEKMLFEFYMPVSKVREEMETTGIQFDLDYATKVARDYREEMESIMVYMDELFKESEFEKLNKPHEPHVINFNSPVQKKKFLYQNIGLEPVKETQKAKELRKYRKDRYTGKYTKPIAFEDASTDKESVKTLIEQQDNIMDYLKEYHEEQYYAVYKDDDMINALVQRGELTAQTLNHMLVWITKSKMISTYLEGTKLKSRLDKDYRLHYSEKLHGTTSGRMASTPNVENLPRKTPGKVLPHGIEKKSSNIRGIFRAEKPAQLFSCDLSQAELRFMAFYAQDEVMIEWVKNKIDIHWKATQGVFSQFEGMTYDEKDGIMKERRKFIKSGNFGRLYGAKTLRVVQSMTEKLDWGDPKPDATIMDIHGDWFFDTFYGIKGYLTEMEHFIKAYGYIDNIFGRRRHLPDAGSDNKTLVDEAVRSGVNAQIQGTSSDVVQLATVEIDKYKKKHKMRSRAIWTVHDEIDGEVFPEELEEWKEMVLHYMTVKTGVMEQINIPLEAEFEVFENRWGD